MQLANKDLIIRDHTEWWPDTSFSDRGPTPEWIAEQGYYVITAWKPHNYNTEKLVSAIPHLYNDMCCLVDVAPLTEEELQAKVASDWQAVRQQRNQLLKDCDWTQLADAPVDKVAWATYRQELRDITNQTDPQNIAWPKQP